MRPTRKTHGLPDHPVATLGLVVALAAMTTTAAACQSDDDRPASFEYIQTAILAPNCATIGCHSEFAAVRTYTFDDFEEAYMDLTGTPCDQARDSDPQTVGLVSPGDPDSSTLTYVLRREDDFGPIMPPDRPLPGADVDLIEQWIAEGARCN